MRNVFIYGGAGLLALILAAVVLIIVIKRRKKNKAIEDERNYWYYQNEWLINFFNTFDVAVYGLKGKGKDVLFAHIINLKNEKHYSNIYYNENTEIRPLDDLHVGGNTYQDLINGTDKKFRPNFEENFDYYISDAGIYIGCQYNDELDKKYGEMPIHFALRRHLYNSRIHTNSQALNRPWNKIREQQGGFLHAIKTENYGTYLIVTAISYTKYESALACLPPPETEDKYSVMRLGEIKEHRFKVPIDSLTYDTRHFKEKLLIYESEVEEHGRTNIVI